MQTGKHKAESHSSDYCICVLRDLCKITDHKLFARSTKRRYLNKDILCSRKCASPGKSSGSEKLPTPTQRAAAD